jgi:hypothetical protein
MPVLIPERTIDSLFAFEFLAAAPSALLWSPNASNPGTTTGSGPTASPGNVDHEVHGIRRFDVECKTIYENGSGSWVNEIPNRQLHAYASNVTTPMFYLLPSKPTNLNAPWHRPCADDPDAGGRCFSCRNPASSAGPIHYRRWAGNAMHYQAAPAQRKLQAWFSHWAWCVRPVDLLDHISEGGKIAIPWGNITEISAQDHDLAGIPGAIRFCHLLSAVEADWRNRYLPPAKDASPDDTRADVNSFVYDVNLDEWSAADSAATSPANMAADVELESRLVQALY